MPGRPDLVFPARRAVVFVHGCFWHRHQCSYFRWPKTNAEFWRDKISKNVVRDHLIEAKLREMEWNICVLWECELRATGYTMPNPAVDRVASELFKLMRLK